LKRFLCQVTANTPLKRGVNEGSAPAVERFEVSGWLALTPALSPRRGRIIRRSWEYRKPAAVRRTHGEREAAERYSLSPGERARVRASVKINFPERNRIHVASHVTKAIPKKQLEQELNHAVRLTPASLEKGRKR